MINAVDLSHCFNVGHCIVFTSWNMFFIPERIFLFLFMLVIISKKTSGVKQAHPDLNRERRFWRPLFYQLNYGPSDILFFEFAFFMYSMFLTKGTKFFYL